MGSWADLMDGESGAEGALTLEGALPGGQFRAPSEMHTSEAARLTAASASHQGSWNTAWRTGRRGNMRALILPASTIQRVIELRQQRLADQHPVLVRVGDVADRIPQPDQIFAAQSIPIFRVQREEVG